MISKLQSGHDFVTGTATYKVQSGITKTIYIQVLRFLLSANRLMLINISMTLHERFSSYRATGRMAFYSVLGIAKV